ncbi:zona pellucida sperm-binding protein 2-like [Odontesthes bonariensis]|uniref:zona pellucida sperm-binding protein 2-like n=1 Tax=Odontesthes bonariensis TaxID=219752 RepID=UPI003F585905
MTLQVLSGSAVLHGIDTICLGNVMRVDVGPLGGKLLEVAASINNSVVVITPSLASQCGFRVKTEKPGNTMIYASLPNCFAQNVEDKMFTTTLQLRVHGNRFAEDELYQVTETCHYTAWASREIICNQNFMEVSVKRAAPHDYTLPKPSIPQASGQSVTSRRAAEKLPIDAGFRLTTVVFFTPAGEKTMSVADAHRNGYGIGNTPTRLVLRSPMMAPETYTQHFAGVTMRVFKTSIIFEKKWLASQIDATAACPMKEGSVFFTSDTITWYLPRQIDPMISSEHFNLLEVHFGLDGQRLNAETMHARQYSLSLNDLYIVVQIPIGAVGGHYKSHIQQNQYHVSYVIEPMLEMLWAEDSPHEQTRYKVLFHIATHLLPRPLQLVDETVPAEQVFKLVLGHFALDVALINISFPSEVLTLTDCRARGFNIMEHISVNGSTKIFALQVPFTDPAVSKMGDGVVAYSLHLTFGLLVLDSFVTFSHTAHVEAVSPNMALPPSVSGGCDHQNFYVLVKYGSQSFRFQTTVGKQLLTPSLAQHYNYMENGTHFSFTVPFSASDVAVEAVKSSSIRSRLNVVLSNPETKSEIQDFSLVCNFPSGLTECFPNGTMTALAVKVDSVPALNPRLLTLQDPTCGPVYSDDHYAYFVFTVNSCGTTRKFLPDSMLYENEISLPDELEMKPGSDSEEPEYELKISCIYDINTSHAVAFYTRLRRSEPYAENSTGLLQIEMRLSLDNFYSTFQTVEDYPIAKYLQQPLYFEVQLMGSTNPKVSLELENCWATQDEDRNSQPRWNLIINGCPNPVDTYQVVFHPVQADSRVQYPSHFKRFEVQMFAFAEGEDDLNGQLFVHCDIVICDAKNPLGGVCGGQCPNPESSARGQRHVSDFHDFSHVSAGPIIIN